MEFYGRKIISGDSRAFRRLRAFCLLKYSLANDPSHKRILVNPRNISAGGALFISDINIPRGVLLEMDIYLPPLKDFFTVMASAVGSIKIEETQQYWIRTRFTAIDPEVKKSINFYIEQLAKNPLIRKYLDKKAVTFRRKFH